MLSVRNDAEETRFWRNQKVVPENTYVYDSLYQQVRATGREMASAGQQGSNLPSAAVPLTTDSSAFTNYTRTYTYDEAGNLTQIRHRAPATGNNYTTDITVSSRSNRGVLGTLTENVADVDALFTAGGQQKQLQPGQKLTWTSRNELLKVTPVVRDGAADDRESYRYDAGNQRVLKVSVQKTNSSTQTQRVAYLPGLELRSTKAGSAETESLQVITAGEAGRAQVRVLHWTGGKPEGISNDQVRYSYDNLAGSGQLELDSDGKVISTEEYYPYGGTAVLAGRSQTEVEYKTVRYSGKERDATGLYYYGYRYYQPWSGRWLSADPAGTMDGLNLFRMVRNNPVTLWDNNGLSPSALLKEQVGQSILQAVGIIEKAYMVIERKDQKADDVMNIFFGDTSDTRKNIFRNDLIKTRELMLDFDVDINLNESPLSEESNSIATTDMNKYNEYASYRNVIKKYESMLGDNNKKEIEKILREKDKLYATQRKSKFIQVNSKNWGVARKYAGDDYIAQVMIHEFSHAALDTVDYVYGKSLSGIDPTPLFFLPSGNVPEEYQQPPLRLKNIKPGKEYLSEIAYKNADSFAYATTFLAYSSSKKTERKELYSRFITNSGRKNN